MKKISVKHKIILDCVTKSLRRAPHLTVPAAAHVDNMKNVLHEVQTLHGREPSIAISDYVTAALKSAVVQGLLIQHGNGWYSKAS